MPLSLPNEDARNLPPLPPSPIKKSLSELFGPLSQSNCGRVAVVGGGITGMACAFALKKAGVSVVLFEKEPTLGGHAKTVVVDDGVEVDLGFMVMNHSNYPNFCLLLKDLGVQTEISDMSLSVSLSDSGGDAIEWSSNLGRIALSRPSLLCSSPFLRMVPEILRFNKVAPTVLKWTMNDPRRFTTVGEWMWDNNFGANFLTCYFYPMSAALWSADVKDIGDFPIHEGKSIPSLKVLKCYELRNRLTYGQ